MHGVPKRFYDAIAYSISPPSDTIDINYQQRHIETTWTFFVEKDKK
jgi:hypothetical protein